MTLELQEFKLIGGKRCFLVFFFFHSPDILLGKRFGNKSSSEENLWRANLTFSRLGTSGQWAEII